MIRRLAFALAVMSGAIYWAHCTFTPGVASLSSSPFFAGCFRGPVTDPAGLGDLTIVLEAKENNMLGGCIWWPRGALGPENGTLVGTVDKDATEQAHLRVMSSASDSTSDPTFTLLVRRAPPGNSNSETVTVSAPFGGVFFTSTAALPHCPITPIPTPPCTDRGISVPFLPGGGMP